MNESDTSGVALTIPRHFIQMTSKPSNLCTLVEDWLIFIHRDGAWLQLTLAGFLCMLAAQRLIALHSTPRSQTQLEISGCKRPWTFRRRNPPLV
jgi:hypothetical protein